jgi:hypothetical protein
MTLGVPNSISIHQLEISADYFHTIILGSVSKTDEFTDMHGKNA